MAWWWFTDRGFCFGFQRKKKLRSHHLCGSLNHSLAHARDCSAHLQVSSVFDIGVSPCASRSKSPDPSKTRRAFALDDNSVMFRRPHIFKPYRSRENSLDCANASPDRCRVSFSASLSQAFASGNATLQHLRISQTFIDTFARSVELVGAFNFHRFIEAE